MFRVSMAVIAVALVAAGCRDKQLEALEAVRSEVCACKSSSCGEAALKKIPPHDAKSSHEAQVVAKKTMDCMARLYLNERPQTDPDAETGSAIHMGPPAP